MAYDGTREGDGAIITAGLMALRDRTQLTIAVLVVLEQSARWATRWRRGTGI